MNTTRTAQYLSQISFSIFHFEIPQSEDTKKSPLTHPAAAPKISCRLALVKKLNTPENARVKSSRTPMIITASGLDPPGLIVHRCQRMYTGTTIKTRITSVMRKVTSTLIRDLV
jgi:hypothetical protein